MSTKLWGDKRMKRTMRKGIVRAITGSMGRFLSVFSIVAIGCGLFAGVRSAGDEMRATTDRYFDSSVLADAQIYTPIGFRESDLERFSGMEGVARFMPGCVVVAESEYGDEIRNVRVQTISGGEIYDRINLPKVIEGRLPGAPDECVVEYRAIQDGSYSLGEKVKLTIPDGSTQSMLLRENDLTIVGAIDSPLYLSFSWSAISIVSSEPKYNIFTGNDAFYPDRFNFMYFTFKGSADAFSYSPEYDEIIQDGTGNLRYEARVWANDLYAAYSGGAVNEFPEISEELIREFFDSGSEPFYVLTRDDVQGYTLFENDARRVDGLAKIFPALFYLVAALVCLTTMTRMVDEERIQIGVMKALGYSAAAISVKYVAYATLAGLLGGLFGTAIGFQIFPRVIYKPYLIMYRLPPIRPVFRYEHAWPALLIAVFAIVLATVFAILKILRSRPAELMRPKPPLVGRSVPAEKVGLIWNRMSFFHKVTVRNLFRYEKRLIMTVLGIAGCTALILTGFGLRNAVNDIIDKQFSDILLHDIRVYLKDPVTDVQSDVSISLLSSIEGVEGVCPISAQTATVFGEDGEELELSLVVPADVDQFKDYFNLRERESGRPIALPADGVILSEKASKLLGLRKGDTARIEPAGSEAFEAPIVAIAENYVEHYVYMSPEYASRVFGNLEPINVLLTRTDDLDGDAADLLAKEILEKDEFSALMSYSTVKARMHVIFRNLDALIYVLIGSAFALALIVLYNLTNINVKERIREIATLKVLGFYDTEVSAYVFRENAVLTLVGAGPGLLLGMLMHSSVTLSGEVDMIMFGRQIHPESFVLAFLITCGFSVIIHAIMHFYLKRIGMVESLKSVE